MKNILIFFSSFFIGLFSFGSLDGQETVTIKPGIHTFQVPKEYLRERETIPDFWITTNDEILNFLQTRIKKGEVKQLGLSAGGRPIFGVFYGNPRKGKGTSTYSGSLGFRDVQAFRGPDHDKKVFLGMGGMHGFETETIMGVVNLLSVMESGKDLSGKLRPEITDMIKQLDRIILIPLLNPDGRNRVPIRMAPYRGEDETIIEYLNTGGNPDGTITGWPEVKKQIPFDFSTPVFPGGYPNDAGVNIVHDDFLGNQQPETKLLFDLVKKEKPDLILNMHTGAVYPLMLRPLLNSSMNAVFDSLFRYVHKGFTENGFQRTNNVEVEADAQAKRPRPMLFSIDAALNFHCGALSVVIETPSHGFSNGKDNEGNPIVFTPEMLLDVQMISYREAIRFLADTGGLSQWEISY
ncbi:hypothetical protein D1164_17610 [Mariniphaga sediminis]|uniref:Peptidase M14 domain-containing protein n=1 Tax=Mariniphaga sediminis TaxID=1628158 RepID=A0A399CX05_9BACT|nr:M14 family zinc carboxypeptidase [Mariniphaga sediminis]RIH63756.1 hypothetical protein D1164_17610 [Mariniphaga sediminis]